MLLKGFGERGFVFFTNYRSRKGRELAENPHAALLFHWAPLGRQVRVEGRVTRVLREESREYFETRAPGSRLSAAVSPQSEVVPSREELEQAVAALRARVGSDVPLPADWGGYRVSPTSWEFWEHRDDRLHDRFRYRRGRGRWIVERLAP